MVPLLVTPPVNVGAKNTSRPIAPPVLTRPLLATPPVKVLTVWMRIPVADPVTVPLLTTPPANVLMPTTTMPPPPVPTSVPLLVIPPAKVEMRPTTMAWRALIVPLLVTLPENELANVGEKNRTTPLPLAVMVPELLTPPEISPLLT